MKYLNKLKYFLGIEIAMESNEAIFMSRKCVLDLLSETSILDRKPKNTSIENHYKLGEYSNQVPTNKAKYQRSVGILV